MRFIKKNNKVLLSIPSEFSSVNFCLRKNEIKEETMIWFSVAFICSLTRDKGQG